ncbi:MAG: type II toxin-antitoxin system HipA family toxin [Longimicrobiales bacterium]|nr:type II toxin-antitoxin system HipA family toxin [Longimicrobiales bacterium]
MAEARAAAEVRLWGQVVGAVAELENGVVLFEYTDAFRRSGLEMSPVHLPLSLAGQVRFPELLRSEAFEGLPGVLADSLPDRFGNRVIEGFFKAKGRPTSDLTPVQKLLYVGERAMGALTFHPADELSLRAPEEEALELADLVRDARRIIEGDVRVAVPEIYRIGSSAGGARPKALVLHDPSTVLIRSGHAQPRPGEMRCILKLDGVGDGSTLSDLGRPLPFNRIEVAYMRMAAEAGLDVAHADLLAADGYAHILIRRFDLSGDERIHQHTLGGLLHLDYNIPGLSSYEEFLRTALRIGLTPDGVLEGFRRMVFNVMAVNQDDHVKNLSFQMRPDGVWRLAPAYDLTFARGSGYTRRHQMAVNGKTAGISREDLLEVARTLGVKRPLGILARIRECLGRWATTAAEAGVPPGDVRRIGEELEARRREIES